MAADQKSDSAGFRDGTNSVHTSRTMMLRELGVVLEKLPSSAPPAAYRDGIVDGNILGKPTRTTRLRTAQRLAELYLLDPREAPFRVFRDIWSADAKAQPMLALLLACWRDPLLRQTTPFVLAVPAGQPVVAQLIASYVQQANPQRFGKSTLTSTAQNLASSWSQCGYLKGKFKKFRDRPMVTPLVAAYALFLAHLRGGRGDLLIDSPWARLLDRSPNEIRDLVAEASKQGWLRHKSSGAVTEITFPNWSASVSSSAPAQEVA